MKDKKLLGKLDSKVRAQKRKRCPYRTFPYQRVAKMWEKGMTIARIARAINRVDKNNPRDPFHSLRNFLYRMHKGFVNGNGQFVRLPYRVSSKTVRAAREAGLRAW